MPSTVSAPNQLSADWSCPSLRLKTACLKEHKDLSSRTTSLYCCSISHLSPCPFFHTFLEPKYKGSYHQLSLLSTEKLKILTPVPVPYTGRTLNQQGKRISNEDPYLTEERTTTTFLAWFSASETLVMIWQTENVRGQRQWDNCEFLSWLCILQGNHWVQSNTTSNLCCAHVRLTNRSGLSQCTEQTDILVCSQLAHTATSEPVPGFSIPSPVNLPLHMKPRSL